MIFVSRLSEPGTMVAFFLLTSVIELTMLGLCLAGIILDEDFILEVLLICKTVFRNFFKLKAKIKYLSTCSDSRF